MSYSEERIPGAWRTPGGERLYRSERSILAPPPGAGEHRGVTPRVVFPTGWDVRSATTIDLYYGMVDSRIGVARTCLPHLLTSSWGQAA